MNTFSFLFLYICFIFAISVCLNDEACFMQHICAMQYVFECLQCETWVHTTVIYVA